MFLDCRPKAHAFSNAGIISVRVREAYLSKKLNEKNIKLKDKSIEDKEVKERPLTVSEAMSQLKEVRAIPVRVEDKTLWIRTDITGNTADVFKAIGAKIPAKKLKVE